MTRLSVNINKIALIRNARGGNIPDLIQIAKDCERFGAQGITVHPRPDERHVRYFDLYELKNIVTTEFNIEGNPTDQFMKIVLDVKPDQVTLVPDAHNALTSNAGWDTIIHFNFLKEIIQEFQTNGIRTSIFTDPVPAIIENAALLGADRVELYTEAYAQDYSKDKSKALKKYFDAAVVAKEANIGLNAGHDLNLENLRYFKLNIPKLLEVSIGHALISDALYFGLENTIQLYLRLLKD